MASTKEYKMREYLCKIEASLCGGICPRDLRRVTLKERNLRCVPEGTEDASIVIGIWNEEVRLMDVQLGRAAIQS